MPVQGQEEDVLAGASGSSVERVVDCFTSVVRVTVEILCEVDGVRSDFYNISKLVKQNPYSSKSIVGLQEKYVTPLNLHCPTLRSMVASTEYANIPRLHLFSL